jgi:uncharacterized protein (DUF488 family)
MILLLISGQAESGGKIGIISIRAEQPESVLSTGRGLNCALQYNRARDLMSAIYTLGHSTRPQQEFLDVLNGFGIRGVADIRTIPRSRKNPQYDQEEFKRWLGEGGIQYMHLRDLGGLRHARADSVNCGWKNLSFRGYADYMQSEQFNHAMEKLMALASTESTAIVCSEAVPWRCHRSLVADALSVCGIEVQHIMSAKSARRHVLTPWAHVDGLKISYPIQET